MALRRHNVDLAVEILGGLLLTAGVIAGAMYLLRRRMSTPRRPDRLPRLTAAIVGNTKGAVAAVLGPPRVATFVGPTSSDYRDARVWYYPLPRDRRLGLAIRFGDDRRAEHVEVIRGPESE